MNFVHLYFSFVSNPAVLSDLPYSNSYINLIIYY